MRKRAARADLIGRFHGAVVQASRAPSLFGDAMLPDNVEGRFESLTLHVLLVLRRLRALPQPATEVAQDLVDAVFAHLEIALRESGIGDFGIPKRMKKLGQAFYDRTSRYDAALDAQDARMLASELATRVGTDVERVLQVARYFIEGERSLATASLDDLLAGPRFAAATEAET